MRSRLAEFELRSPESVGETLEIMAREPGQWRPFAGGTDLMVLLEAGKLPPARYLSLWHLRELRGIEVTEREIAIGPLTTYSDVPRLRRFRPSAPRAAASKQAALSTQNRGTIGGNIATASLAADAARARLRCDARPGVRSRTRQCRMIAFTAASRWIWRPTS